MQLNDALQYFWANRETGEIPVRTRRCDRGPTPQYATVGYGWEGAASRTIRKSEDLPLSFFFGETVNPQAIIAWGFFLVTKRSEQYEIGRNFKKNQTGGQYMDSKGP